MPQSETADTIIRLLAIELDVPEDRVREARSLRGELGMDSIAAANLLFALEEEYGRIFELQKGEKLDNVPEITKAIEREIARDPT